MATHDPNAAGGNARGHRRGPPRLGPRTILRLARQHRKRTGYWPDRHDGEVYQESAVTWAEIDLALQEGGDSLEGLLRRAGVLTDPGPGPTGYPGCPLGSWRNWAVLARWAEGLTLREIGQQFKVSTPRACQLLKRARQAAEGTEPR